MAATKVMTIPEIPKREGLDLDWNMDLDALDLHIPHPAIKVSKAVCVLFIRRMRTTARKGRGSCA